MKKQYEPKREQDFPQLQTVKELVRKNRTRMPYVVEFSGLPKSGKTTVLRRTLRGLERLGLRCSTVTEAATTKIDRSLRSDLFVFNMLCYLENLQSLIRESQRHGTVDVTLVDRGVIDSFVWFEFLNRIGLLRHELRATIESFAFSPTWLDHVNQVVYIKSDWRSYEARFLLDSPIEEEPTLSREYFDALADSYNERYVNQRPSEIRIQEIDGALPMEIEAENVSAPDILRANWEQAHGSSIAIINHIFDGILKDNVEYIATLPGKQFTPLVVAELKNDKINQFVDATFGQTAAGTDGPYGKLNFVMRDKAEVDPNLVQIVAGAYVLRGDRILVLQHSSSEKREQLRGKFSILVTGHVEKIDQTSCSARNPVESCLFRELKEELVNIDYPHVAPRFALRLGKDEMGQRHLGLIYEIKTMSRSPNTSGLPGAGDFEPNPTFWQPSELLAKVDQFSSWSQQIIRWLFADGK